MQGMQQSAKKNRLPVLSPNFTTSVPFSPLSTHKDGNPRRRGRQRRASSALECSHPSGGTGQQRRVRQRTDGGYAPLQIRQSNVVAESSAADVPTTSRRDAALRHHRPRVSR